MQFEWDDNKNKANVDRHEIDFNDAWQIFARPMLSRIDDRKDYGETRYIALGQLDIGVVVVVYTLRQKIIRIISIRRANHYERQIYESQLKE